MSDIEADGEVHPADLDIDVDDAGAPADAAPAATGPGLRVAGKPMVCFIIASQIGHHRRAFEAADMPAATDGPALLGAVVSQWAFQAEPIEPMALYESEL